MAARLRAVACLDDPPLAEIDDAYVVALKDVEIRAAPGMWPDAGVLVFEATKTEHLMTPRAHFYGRKAYGYLLRHDPSGDIVAFTAGELRRPVRVDAGLLLALCRADGKPLPEDSDQFFPRLYRSGRLPTAVPVGRAAFDAVEVGARVYLGPDPDHPDRFAPTVGPPSAGVEPGHVHLEVLRKDPSTPWWRIEFADGAVGQAPTRREFLEIEVGQLALHDAEAGVAARVLRTPHTRAARVVSKRCVRTPATLRGVPLDPMTVLTPLSRDVGRHVAPKRMPMGRPGAGRVFRVRYSGGDLRPGESFAIKNRRVEVLERTDDGAVVLELLRQPARGSLSRSSTPGRS